MKNRSHKAGQVRPVSHFRLPLEGKCADAANSRRGRKAAAHEEEIGWIKYFYPSLVECDEASLLSQIDDSPNKIRRSSVRPNLSGHRYSAKPFDIFVPR